ncbi:flagellar biosynthesis protein FlhF [Pseudomaricurvus alkylphenolicus]|uniref:flagellar biosynthesis protein FlhF n=1 Tax=Pseudomaricurvus alkylphenolicus TaxID=1306991 RepID=UPI0014217233|nr:flagellar biosynthesis protein FlhF [Pseudomaricurvus alkylphenolicus]NIB43190.1 flagellar biosynthesis protein FlhF [Pseudomaricurvus alkylphenolicus]
MSVKRFVAADMRRALELVRQEMGPDAIILSSRRIKQGVEILTSLQPEPAQATPPSPVDTPMPGVDVPMDSDASWREQLAVEEAVQGHATIVNPPIANSVQSRPSLAATSAKSESDHSAPVRGMASGKTPAELAEEIEQARQRMLAAKREQRRLDVSIEELSRRESPQRIEPSMAPKPDYNVEPTQSFHKPETASARVEPKIATELEVRQEEQLKSLQSELADMRLLLEEQLTRMAQTPQHSSPIVAGLIRRFKHMGMTDAAAQQVIGQVRESGTMQQAWTDALAALAHAIPVGNADDLVMRGGVFAFVGPTGVGKTTTIAKLAARYVLENGPENVALVTTDTFRIAAHDQLRALGRILNVQVKVVDDNQDLPAILRSLKGCPLVLIDTAGFRQGDVQLREQLQALALAPEIQPLLVMASNSQLQMMKATIHAHQAARPIGCVLTKLDETASLGEGISVLLEHHLPLLYTTDGQEIPQDLNVARGHKLVARAVALMKSAAASQSVTKLHHS